MEKTTQTTFYQLLIEAQINEDWKGTAFRSMLYSSKEACIKGCCTEEIEEIVETIGRFSEFAVDKFEAMDWLEGEAEVYYDENDEAPIFWIITENQVAT
jgi:hypothetical protein